MRRPLTAIPAIGLALVLGACGGSATTTTNTNPAATPGPAGGAVATEPPPPSGTNEPPPAGGGSLTGSIKDTKDQNGLLALLPPQLCGKTPGKYAFRGESWFQDVDQAALDELASYGKTVDDAFAAMEIVADENACSAGIVRIRGLTSDQLKSVHDKMNKYADVKEVTVDGRTVWEDRHSATGVTYYYLIDDAVVMASALDEAHAREVLALLPRP